MVRGMGKWRRRTLACAGLALCIGATPSVAAASPYIHAHRGGTLRDGKRIWPENTMPAFRSAARHGYVLELDVKLTQDGIPVVIHDATLDRTTPCAGLVADRTLADLGHCKVDVIGAPDDLRQLPRGDPRRAPIPTLRAVLGLLKRTGASANVEIKNIPTEPDYDPTSAYALEVTGAIRGSGVPSSQLIVQSFWPRTSRSPSSSSPPSRPRC